MTATLTIKNIPGDLYTMLKENAAKNHRSINNEIIVLLENAFRSRRVKSEVFLANARRLREWSKTSPLSAADIDQAKYEGRP